MLFISLFSGFLWLKHFLFILAKIFPEEITPLLPAVSGEKIAEDQTCYFLQLLLKYMVIQVRRMYVFNYSYWEDCVLMSFLSLTCFMSFKVVFHILTELSKKVNKFGAVVFSSLLFKCSCSSFSLSRATFCHQQGIDYQYRTWSSSFLFLPF